MGFGPSPLFQVQDKYIPLYDIHPEKRLSLITPIKQKIDRYEEDDDEPIEFIDVKNFV
jgi:hypothetical protein